MHVRAQLRKLRILTKCPRVTAVWDAVKKVKIIKCFRKTGVIGSDFTVVICSFEDHDPFADVNAQEELDTLVSKICSLAEHCLVDG